MYRKTKTRGKNRDKRSKAARDLICLVSESCALVSLKTKKGRKINKGTGNKTSGRKSNDFNELGKKGSLRQRVATFLYWNIRGRVRECLKTKNILHGLSRLIRQTLCPVECFPFFLRRGALLKSP